jgi:hypothetical protein
MLMLEATEAHRAVIKSKTLMRTREWLVGLRKLGQCRFGRVRVLDAKRFQRRIAELL